MMFKLPQIIYFYILVFLTTGGSGPSCTKVIKRVAMSNMLIAHVMGFIRTIIRLTNQVQHTLKKLDGTIAINKF